MANLAALVGSSGSNSGPVEEAVNVLFYFVYALFKVAVIAQQIYARYRAGFTKDERFAALIYVIWLLARMAVLAIEKGRIDDLASG